MRRTRRLLLVLIAGIVSSVAIIYTNQRETQARNAPAVPAVLPASVRTTKAFAGQNMAAAARYGRGWERVVEPRTSGALKGQTSGNFTRSRSVSPAALILATS